MKIPALVIAQLLLSSAPSPGRELSEARLLAPLHNQSAVDGCSWSASSRGVGKGYIFLAEYDQSKILMNIGGVDTDLRLISSRGNLSRLGSVATDVYRSQAGTVVYATYRTTWRCPVGQESCEVTRFDATYEVTTGSRRQVVHGTGAVGC
nr:putative integron gene cassette protein [uncultured bacterium]